MASTSFISFESLAKLSERPPAVQAAISMRLQEYEMEHSHLFCTKIRKILTTGGRGIVEGKRWLSEIDAISEQRYSTRNVTIGVVGDTGVGKSCLMNVLIGVNALQATADSGASVTAVPTVIDYSHENYELDVEFHKENDIVELIKRLEEEWKAEDGQINSQSIDFAKFSLLFPDVDINLVASQSPAKFVELAKKKWHQIGKRLIKSYETPKELKDALEPYISANCEKQAIWHLIKSTKIKVPCELLKEITLIDFPGQNDPNLVRSSSRDLKLDAKIILANCTRASSETSSTSLLFQETLQHGNLTDARWNAGTIVYAITKFDDALPDFDILTSEGKGRERVVEESMPGFANDRRKLTERIAKLEASIDDVQHQKRFNELKALCKQLSVKKPKTWHCQKLVATRPKHLVGEDRARWERAYESANEECKTNKANSKKVKELRRAQLELCNCEQRAFMVLTKNGQRRTIEKLNSNWELEATKFNSLSSKIYHQLRKERSADGPSISKQVPLFWCITLSPRAYQTLETPTIKNALKGYPTFEATGIPELKTILLTMASHIRQRQYLPKFYQFEILINSLSEFINSSDFDQPITAEQSQQMSADCQPLIDDFTAYMRDSVLGMVEETQRVVGSGFLQGLNELVTQIPDYINTYIDTNSTGTLNHATFKAICRREGQTYINRRGTATYNWLETIINGIDLKIKECRAAHIDGQFEEGKRHVMNQFENAMKQYGRGRNEAASRCCKPLEGRLSDMSLEIAGFLQQLQSKVDVAFAKPIKVLNKKTKTIEAEISRFIALLLNQMIRERGKGPGEGDRMREACEEYCRVSGRALMERLLPQLATAVNPAILTLENDMKIINGEIEVDINNCFEGTLAAARAADSKDCKQKIRGVMEEFQNKMDAYCDTLLQDNVYNDPQFSIPAEEIKKPTITLPTDDSDSDSGSDSDEPMDG